MRIFTGTQLALLQYLDQRRDRVIIARNQLLVDIGDAVIRPFNQELLDGFNAEIAALDQYIEFVKQSKGPGVA